MKVKTNWKPNSPMTMSAGDLKKAGMPKILDAESIDVAMREYYDGCIYDNAMEASKGSMEVIAKTPGTTSECGKGISIEEYSNGRCVGHREFVPFDVSF